MPSASLEATGDPAQSPGGRYFFDDFELDLGRGSLLRRGEEIPLRPKSFAMLQYLLEHASQLVTRQELMSAVWPDVVVTDDSIAQCLIELRRALGDDQRTMIRTVPRRGLIFEPPVRFDEGVAAFIAQRRTRIVRHAWSVVGALAVVAALLWWRAGSRAPEGTLDEETATTAAPASIAVLRFTDMSADGAQSYLADGLSEEIMHLLAQVPSLRVIARTSSFAVEGLTIDKVVEQLDVTHVLEGSVRRQGEQVRVTAQLIDAATSAHLWSRTYDRPLDDFLDLQRDIAGAVAALLQVSLAEAEPSLAKTVDPRAYQLYLEGRHFYLRRADGDLDRARQRYEQAVAISPSTGRAWTGLAAIANARLYGGAMAEQNPAERKRLVQDQAYAVEQALKHGPHLPEAQARAARFYFTQGELERARRHFETLRAIDPEHWLVRAKLAEELFLMGRVEEAVPLIIQSTRLDPLNLVEGGNLAGKLVWAGRHADARDELARIAELSGPLVQHSQHLQLLYARVQILTGDYQGALHSAESLTDPIQRMHVQAIARHHLGRSTEADRALAQMVSEVRDDWDALYVAEVHAQQEDVRGALEWLQRRAPASDCAQQLLLTAIYYSPFLAALAECPAWDAYRTDVLQEMRACMWGIQVGATSLAAAALKEK